MGKNRRWVCEKIIKKFHAVSELELKQSLAELWEILVPSTSQIQLCPHKINDPMLNRLSQPEKRTRR